MESYIHVFLFVWPLPFSIIILIFTHIVVCYSFLPSHSTSLWIYHNLLVQSPAYGWVVCSFGLLKIKLPIKFLQKLSIHLLSDQAFIQKKINIYTKIYTINVHNRFIHSSSKLETTHMSISRWMDEQNVVSHTLDSYFGVERNHLLIHAAWMDLRVLS